MMIDVNKALVLIDLHDLSNSDSATARRDGVLAITQQRSPLEPGVAQLCCRASGHDAVAQPPRFSRRGIFAANI
jgi:hypothetical protein